MNSRLYYFFLYTNKHLNSGPTEQSDGSMFKVYVKKIAQNELQK